MTPERPKNLEAYPYLLSLLSLLSLITIIKEFRKGFNGEEVDFGYLYVVLWTLFGLLLDYVHRYIEETKLRKQTLKVTRLMQQLLMVAPEED